MTTERSLLGMQEGRKAGIGFRDSWPPHERFLLRLGDFARELIVQEG